MSIFQKGLFGGSSSGGGGGSGTGWDGRVNTFADLPSAAANTGKYYMVDTATGTHGVDRKEAGIYKSNGSSWTLCGTAPLTAVVVGGIVVAAAALGVFGSSTIKVTPDAINGTLTIEGNYTGGTGIDITGNTVTATYSGMGSGVTWENGVPSSRYAAGVKRPIVQRMPYNVTLDRVDGGFDIDPTTEGNSNLKKADDCFNYANATVLAPLDTTAGRVSIVGSGNFSNSTVAAGQCVYQEYDAAPDSACGGEGYTLGWHR